MADPILNGKPMKMCKNGSDMICLSAFHVSSYSSIFDCLWTFNLFLGQSQQKTTAVVKLWKNETDSNAACSFACDEWTDFTERSDVEKTRSDKGWDMSFHGKLSVKSCSRSCHDVGERNGCFVN